MWAMFSVFIPMDFPWVLLIGSPGLIFHLPENCVSINILFILPKTVQNCGDSKTYPICKVKVSPLHFVDAVRRHRTPGSGGLKGFVTNGTANSMSINIFVLFYLSPSPTWGQGERDATCSGNFHSCQDSLT